MKKNLAVLIREATPESTLFPKLQSMPAEAWASAALLQKSGNVEVSLIPPSKNYRTDLRSRALFQRLVRIPLSPMHLWHLRRVSANFDIFLANSLAWTYQLALAKRFAVLGKNKAAAITYGLASTLAELSDSLRHLHVWLLNGLDTIVVNTEVEKEDLLRLNITNVEYLKFGVDADFWNSDSVHYSTGTYVFSPGNDPKRDWDTLVSGCTSNLVIATSSKDITRKLVPENVSVTSGTYLDMKSYYTGCRCVAVTLPESRRIAGEYTALQSMAMKRPLVLTHTSGTNHDFFIHNETCFLIPPNDPLTCRDALEHVFGGGDQVSRVVARAHELIRTVANSQRYTEELLQLLISL